METSWGRTPAEAMGRRGRAAESMNAFEMVTILVLKFDKKNWRIKKRLLYITMHHMLYLLSNNIRNTTDAVSLKTSVPPGPNSPSCDVSVVAAASDVSTGPHSFWPEATEISSILLSGQRRDDSMPGGCPLLSANVHFQLVTAGLQRSHQRTSANQHAEHPLHHVQNMTYILGWSLNLSDRYSATARKRSVHAPRGSFLFRVIPSHNILRGE